MTHPKTKTAATCPCGHTLSYDECCGRWHAGPQQGQAPSAEALMRSRYSAFVLSLTEYLLQTWHPDTRPAALEPDPPGTQWLGLQVRKHQPAGDNHATVEFVARTRLHGRAHRLHETSRFERLDGRWYYRDGDFHG